MAALIQNKEWRFLLREIGKLESWKEARALTQKQAQWLLAAPVAVAHALASLAPLAPETTRLRLLVINPQVLDTMESGRAWQAIGPLLGRPLEVETTLVGGNIRTKNDGVLKKLPAATIHAIKLADYLENEPQVDFDLVVCCHHPQETTPWAELVEQLPNVPVVLVTPDEVTAGIEQQRWAALGWKLMSAILENPHALRPETATGETLCWGTHLAVNLPNKERKFDPEHLGLVHNFYAMQQHGVRQGFHPAGQGDLFPGEELEAVLGEDKVAMIYLGENLIAERTQGAILRLIENGSKFEETGTTLTAGELTTWPSAHPPAVKALWATTIKKARLNAKAWPAIPPGEQDPTGKLNWVD